MNTANSRHTYMPDKIDFQIIPSFAIITIHERGEILSATVADTVNPDNEAHPLCGRNLFVLFGVDRCAIQSSIRNGPVSVTAQVKSNNTLCDFELQFYPPALGSNTMTVAAFNISKHTAALNETLVLIEKQAAHIAALEQYKAFGSKVLASVAHDLRGPINSLVATTQLLAEDQLSEGELRNVTQTIAAQTGPLVQLVENLFRWATVSMTAGPQQRVSVSIGSMVQQALEILTREALHKMIAVETDVPDEAVVWCNPDEAGIVIRNLLANAIKFTKRGGYILLRAFIDRGMVHTVVADNGVGMDIQQKEALFSAGGTQSRFGTDGEHGTGIGLLLCREYVARNGGQLHVASAPGCGSAFTVSLPMPAAMQTAVA